MEDANSAQISTFAHGVRVPRSWKPPPGMAAAIWQLLTTQHTWVHRRVETVDVLSGEMVKRTMSIDFTIPPRLRRLLADPDSGGYFVPIALLAKEPRRNFSLRDESGQAIPVLGREMNAEIAAALLRHGVESRAGQSGHRPLSGKADKALRAIVEHRGERTTLAVYELLSEQRRAAGGDLDGLFRDEVLTEMAAVLVNRYVLSVVIRDIDVRRVLKVSFEERIADFAQSWGSSSRVEIPVYGPGFSTSYHLEIVVPEELKIELAALRHRYSEMPVTIERYADRAALYSPWVDEGFGWEARAELQIERLGLPTQALVASSLTSAVLAAATASGAFSGSKPALPVSLLLSASAIASGFSFIMGEHRLLRAVFMPVRLLLLFSLVSAVIAASVVAFDISSWAGLGAAVVSWVVTAMLAVIVMRSAPLRRPTEES